MVDILLVDDGSGEMLLTQAALKGALEYSLTHVRTAQEALTHLSSSGKPSLILVDLYLESLDEGLGLIRQLSQAGHTVVGYSNATRPESQKAALDAGALAFQLKPNGVDAIRTALLGLIKTHAMGAA